MLKQVRHLCEAGFALHWLHPQSKRPIGRDWSTKPVATLDELKETWRDGRNVGVRTGKWSDLGGVYLHIIDVDIRKPELSVDAHKMLAKMLPELDLFVAPTVISGSGGASRHYYLLSDKPFPSRKFAHSPTFEMVHDERIGRAVKKWDWELHLLGTGSQAAIPPSVHPDTGREYVWDVEFDMGDLDLGIVAAVPSEALERLIGFESDVDIDPERQRPVGMSIEDMRSHISHLPVDAWIEDRDGWMRLGMAIHHETGGSKEGFGLWKSFSELSDKFDLKDSKVVWRSFKNHTGRPFRMLSIVAAANDARLEAEIEDYGVDDLEDEGPEFEDFGDEQPYGGMFDDILGGSPEELARTKTQRKLAKENVEQALGIDAPKWVRRFNKKNAIAIVGGKTLVLHFKNNGKVDYGSVHDLHSYYENDRVPMNETTQPRSKAWMQSKYRRSYPEGIVFAPNQTVEGAYNHWQGFSVEASKMEKPEFGCRLFLKHLKDVICNGNEEYYRYQLGWLAHMIQKPEEKPGVAVVYRGRKRIGKDTVFVYVGKLFKEHYVSVASQQHVTGRFNPQQEKCLLLHMEEGYWAGDKASESLLKNLITSETVNIEPKGVNPFQVNSVIRLFISSNERWVVPATEDEGRYFILNVSDKRRSDHQYFGELRREMNGDGPSCLLAYLMAYDISDFEVRAVPNTEALGEQKSESLKNLDRWWLDVLQSGDLEGLVPAEAGRGSEWMHSHMQIGKNEFREAYEMWMRGRRYEGPVMGDAAITKRMGELCHGVATKRPRNVGGSRARAYVFPPLDVCREMFEQHLGSIVDWEDIPEDDTADEDDDLA